jgi:hypothetical protein
VPEPPLYTTPHLAFEPQQPAGTDPPSSHAVLSPRDEAPLVQDRAVSLAMKDSAPSRTSAHDSDGTQQQKQCRMNIGEDRRCDSAQQPLSSCLEPPRTSQDRSRLHRRPEMREAVPYGKTLTFPFKGCLLTAPDRFHPPGTFLWALRPINVLSSIFRLPRDADQGERFHRPLPPCHLLPRWA